MPAGDVPAREVPLREVPTRSTGGRAARRNTASRAVPARELLSREAAPAEAPTPDPESTRDTGTHRTGAHRTSPDRPARDRDDNRWDWRHKASSTRKPNARTASPRAAARQAAAPARGRGRSKRFGVGLIAMVLIAAGVTAAAGYALSKSDGASTINASKANAATPCNQTGPGQRDVEAYLATRTALFGKVTADAKQSAADCTAIAAFQRWAQVPSQTGFADTTTGFLARQLASVKFDQCGAPGDRTTVCVDLTNQVMWVVRSGRVILGPTTARSGRPGQLTPTGQFKITQKKVSTISSEYGTPLPYWERFVDDIGFHQADTPMYAAIPGSFGCINLLERDAKALYGLTEIGTTVKVFGKKPGT